MLVLHESIIGNLSVSGSLYELHACRAVQLQADIKRPHILTSLIRRPTQAEENTYIIV